MFQILFGCTGIQYRTQVATGQYKCATTGNKRYGVEWKKNETYESKVFFIQDRIKVGDVSIDHCGTDEKIADYFTKPLQGRKFEYFRAVIMGFDLHSTDRNMVTWNNFKGKRDHLPKECVGDSQIIKSEASFKQ